MVDILDTGTNVTVTTSLSPPDHGTEKFSTSVPVTSTTTILLLNKILIFRR